MKRIIFPVLGCLFVTFCFAEVQHVEVTKSISYDYDTSEGWLHITGSGAMPDYGKTSSVAPWNWLGGYIEEVTIDEGITSIGKYAFYEFKKMVSLTFPSTITKSGKDAFAYCTAQPNIFIDDLEAWLKVDWGAVATSGISQPTMSGGYLYLDGDLLEDVYIPSSISTLRTNVFYKNYGIKNLYIPTSVTEIQEHATNLCMSMENIYYYGDIDSWCKVKINSTTALYRKEGAKLWINDRLISGTLTIPSSVSKIGDHTFEYIQDINNLVIKDGVQTIGSSAFYMDGGLLSVELGKDCKQIGSYAFAGCSNLQKIVVKSVAPPTVSNNAFDNVSTSIPVIVPQGSLDKYKASTTWKKFTNLQEEITEPAVILPSDGSTLTCAEAVDYANQLDHNSPTTQTYTIYGYVTSTDGVISQNQQTFWIADTKNGGNVFEIYWGNVSQQLQVGDYVKCVGHLMRFYSTPEMKNPNVTLVYRSTNNAGSTIDITPNYVELDYFTQYDDFWLRLFELDDNNNTIQMARYGIPVLSSPQHLVGSYSMGNGTLYSNECAYYNASEGEYIDAIDADINVQYVGEYSKYPVYVFNGSMTLTDGRVININNARSIVLGTYVNIENNSLVFGDDYELTDGATSIEEVQTESKATKVIRDGQIFILRGEKVYTMTGQEVK